MTSNATPKVHIEAQGSLLTVTPQIDYQGITTNNGDSRGEITGFSARSRKRLLELVAKLDIKDRDGYRANTSFLTLTTKAILHPIPFKIFMFSFLKRLKRKSPRISAIWRIEPQKRGATHAHLILLNAPYLPKEWIQASWGEIIDELRPFTRIERVNSRRKIMSYASKYVAKGLAGFNYVPYLTVDKTTGEIDDRIGRQWGVYQRETLPWATLHETDVKLDGSWWLIRSYCKRLWEGLEDATGKGFTIFCDNPNEHLERLVLISKQFIVAANSS